MIFVGLQGAGKTTFYQQRYAATHALVSKDLMRSARRPAERQLLLVAESLAARRSVVVDNTNPSVASRAELIQLGRAARARLVAVYFPPDVPASLRRNAGRQGRARVPEVAIHATRKQLVPPTLAEGFDDVIVVHLVDEVGFQTSAGR